LTPRPRGEEPLFIPPFSIVLEKNNQQQSLFFRPKISKIAENCDHNIDPWPEGIVRFFLSAETSRPATRAQPPDADQAAFRRRHDQQRRPGVDLESML
jgi:hypothetical protein